MKHGKNLALVEISQEIAEEAGRLKGRYPFLKTVDALLLASALSVRADAFLTNDAKLSQFQGLKVLVLRDHL